jgi:hypothetical protein
VTPVPLISNARAGEILASWYGWNEPDPDNHWFDWYDRSTRAWIYFADAGDVFKVGWSHGPLRRIASLRHDFYAKDPIRPLVFISDGCFTDEQTILELLHRFRVIDREYIEKAPEVVELVAALRLNAEACFFDNRKAGYARLVRRCKACGQTDHKGQYCLKRRAA